MVNPAAPLLFVRLPLCWSVNCAIERVNGTRWTGWPQRLWSGWRRWWGGWRRSWRWSWRGCLQHCAWWRCGAADADRGATILLLSHRPRGFPCGRPCGAIVAGSSAEPQQQRQEQQKTQKAACGDDAGEVSSWTHCIEVSTAADILVGSFLDVCSLSCSNITDCPRTSTSATAAHSASCAILSS